MSPLCSMRVNDWYSFVWVGTRFTQAMPPKPEAMFIIVADNHAHPWMEDVLLRWLGDVPRGWNYELISGGRNIVVYAPVTSVVKDWGNYLKARKRSLNAAIQRRWHRQENIPDGTYEGLVISYHDEGRRRYLDISVNFTAIFVHMEDKFGFHVAGNRVPISVKNGIGTLI